MRNTGTGYVFTRFPNELSNEDRAVESGESVACPREVTRVPFEYAFAFAGTLVIVTKGKVAVIRPPRPHGAIADLINAISNAKK